MGATMPGHKTDAMKPIRLTLCKPFEKIPTGSSRFWGNPDLPSPVVYPTYIGEDGQEWEYQFVCQINLSDIADLDVENRLPHKGLLSFFAKIDHYLGRFDDGSGISGYISDPADVKVLYFPDVTDDFQEAVLVDDDEEWLNPAEFEIKFERTLPDIYHEDHALFAEPTHREWDTWDPPFEDWQILLQIDSFSGMDFNLNFMDFGVLDFLISPDDLAAARFDNIRAIVLST